jgi:hypothetical protein
VTLAYMGDGAINQGAVHESMNLAALWKLPIIYIIENNEYSMGTSQARSSAGDPLTKRAGAFDMAAIQANGMDIDDVRAKTFEAVSLARTESQPTLMEIRTYRYFGHSMSDPGHYRSKEEIEARRRSDPIELYKARLVEQKVARRPTISPSRAPSRRLRPFSRTSSHRRIRSLSSGPMSATLDPASSSCSRPAAFLIVFPLESLCPPLPTAKPSTRPWPKRWSAMIASC